MKPQLVFTNPNKPEPSRFAITRIETIPQPANERTYYMVRPSSAMYFTVQDGQKFSMRQFLGGAL